MNKRTGQKQKRIVRKKRAERYDDEAVSKAKNSNEDWNWLRKGYAVSICSEKARGFETDFQGSYLVKGQMTVIGVNYFQLNSSFTRSLKFHRLYKVQNSLQLVKLIIK